MDSSVLRAWSKVIALSGDRPCSSRDLMEGLFVQLESLDPAADLLRARDFAATGDAPEDPAWVGLGWDVLWPGRSLARDYLANTSGWRADFEAALGKYSGTLNAYGLIGQREVAERAQVEFDEIFSHWPEALDLGEPVPGSQVVCIERWARPRGDR